MDPLGLKLKKFFSVTRECVTSIIMFKAIKHTIGLRASEQEELQGLDLGEHGSECYPDFLKK